MRFLSIAVAFACSLTACKSDPPAPPPRRVFVPPGAQPAQAPEDLADSSGFHPLVRKPDMAVPARANTINGDKNGPKQSDFDSVESDGQAKVGSCFDGKWAPDAGAAHVSVRFTVGNDGKVSEAQIDAAVAADVGACIRTAVEGMTFPKFEGPVVHTSFQSTFRKGG